MTVVNINPNKTREFFTRFNLKIRRSGLMFDYLFSMLKLAPNPETVTLKFAPVTR
jgi:hypothetical protein